MSSPDDAKKTLTVLLVILTLALTGIQATRRAGWDRANRKYTLATGYSDFSRTASIYGETGVELAKRLRKAGIRLVVFEADLATAGELNPPEAADRLREAGLELGLEVRNVQLGGDEEFGHLLAVLDELHPAYLLLRGVEAVDPPPALGDWIEENDVTLGTVEFRNEGTTARVVEKRGLRHVRLHRVFEEETGTLSGVERVARYVRAVEERNIGVIEYGLPPGVELADRVGELETIRAELAASGYELVPLDRAKGSGEAPKTPYWLLLTLIVGSLGSGCLLLFDESVSLTALLSGLVLLGVAAAGGLALFPVPTRQIAALAVAVGAPPVAYRLLKTHGLSHRPKRIPGAAYLDFLSVSLFSTSAGLVVSSILLDGLFLLKLYQFRGVKLALFFPILVLLATAVRSGEFRLSEIDFSYWKVLAGGGLLLLFLFLLVRSGNFSFLRSTELEEAIRRWLDSTLTVRPRFKEFVIGHPALLAWLYFVGRYGEGCQFCKLGLFLLGFIGQVSIINTFIHVHTPITVSLIRTANGLAVGLILGTGLIVTLVGGVYLWKLRTG